MLLVNFSDCGGNDKLEQSSQESVTIVEGRGGRCAGSPGDVARVERITDFKKAY